MGVLRGPGGSNMTKKYYRYWNKTKKYYRYWNKNTVILLI
jgi:hypothetical protein